MKKILLVSAFLLFQCQQIFSQCAVLANAVQGVSLVSAGGGTSNRSGLAFNPQFNLYYSVNAGSPSYPVNTFDLNGVLMGSTPAQGFDYRGAWWNPNTNQFEGNGYSSLGIWKHNLDVNGYAIGTGANIFTGMAQPDVQSCGDLDYLNNEIIYYNAGSVYRYSRATNAFIGSSVVTGLPVSTSNLNWNTIMYTGCAGQEYALYDYVLKRVYFINRTGTAYVTYSQLPANAPAASAFQVSWANNQVWIYDASGSAWRSYQALQLCQAPNATASALGNTSFCLGDSVTLAAGVQTGYTFQWLRNNTVIPGATDSLLTVSTGGSYSVLVTVNMGCRDTSSTVNVTVNSPPSPSLNPPGGSVVCQGNPVQLNAAQGQGYIYQWYMNGSAIPGANSASYLADSGGTYYAEIRDTNNCAVVSDSFALSVNTPVSAQLQPQSVRFCEGETGWLHESSGAGAAWQWLMNGNVIAGQADDSLNVFAAGTYQVVMTDTNGCSDSSSLSSVIVYSVPHPILTVNQDTICADTFAAYQWFYNGNPMTGETLACIVPNQSGLYSVQVTSSQGCSGTSAQVNFIYTPVGMEEGMGLRVMLYPNPAEDYLHIRMEDAEFNVNVLDLQGRSLIQGLRSSGGTIRIDLSSLASGMYFAEIESAGARNVIRFLKH